MDSGGLATMVLLSLKMRSMKGINVEITNDMMSLGGLLEEDSIKGSFCLSKRELALYRKPSPYKPSSYLVSRLRKYEAMHRKCGPNTKKYQEAVKLLISNYSSNEHEEDCKYLIWIPPKGLGNKLVSLVSTFLYALLTDRVLLLEQQISMKDLLCEPFENTTWLLPEDLPLRSEFGSLRHGSPFSYGNMLKTTNTNNQRPPFVYLHLAFDYDTHDMLFFCDEYQTPLRNVPWLVTRSDQYFAPSLFLMPFFEEELGKLFPEKDTVFHHLGRYLLHPSNVVWGLVKRYYDSYLANAEERIGIQIRDFRTTPLGFTRMKKHIYNYYLPHFSHDESSSREIKDLCNVTSLDLHMMDRIVSCFLENKLLPKVVHNRNYDDTLSTRSKAVLVTSLTSSYYDKISDMYWDHATETGEGIGVYQPSHEGVQHSDMTSHNAKAWAEIYLLSLMDVVITSPVSSFGYVAQGLGGKRAWMINGPHREFVSDSEPSCFQVASMEPCFHNPPYYDCKARGRADTGSVAPYVQHCEDLKWGLKLVDAH
ncbi:galactoside 2-alpha-L-fucosyltransferase-like [Impatiens glandulifera]|uniref:galactoside 2-alpha-L-fucosyltransferase-like n=1 Tax=Impatiens glandulifera TaxID=253017 RepID=UPI001FB0DB58|nr:galactoside 2-alpha-L-fucosyltransferase-like [Impatiens glandulifera]